MSYLRHIDACNAFDPDHFRDFLIAGTVVGRVKADTMVRLAAFPDVFVVEDDVVALHPRLDTPDVRTQAVQAVLARLAEAGALDPLRDEAYDVVLGWGKPPLMRIDRAAISLLGLRAFGLHVNGYVRRPDGLHLWIGKRAADKSVAPGKLDNMVAGGQPSGLTLAENLLKEADEEASLPASLARRAVPVGAVAYCMETDKGFKPDVMFCYDLEIPADFTPVNRDGEMERFDLMPVEAVAERVRSSDDFKFNVNLVLIDFLIRHGFLTPDTEPTYTALVAGLRRGFAAGC